VLRKWRGKTQLYISHKTNIGQGYIFRLGKRTEKGNTRQERLGSGPLRIKDPRREAMLEPEEVSNGLPENLGLAATP
jgi:hypothetical protein